MDPKDKTANPAATENVADTPAADTPSEPKGDEAALAALDKGIEEGSSAPAAAAASEPAAAAVEQPGADPKASEVATDPKAAATTPAAADPAKPAATPAATKPEPDAEVEAEIKALKLSAKSGERFRTMSAEIKAFAPIKEALEKAGIKDAATFQQAMPQLVQRSQDFEDLVGMVSDTGATPEMYSAMLDYMKDSVAAVNGDPSAAQRSYDRSLRELTIWAKMLGRELPGVVDPLEGHPDLKAEVESGDLSRPRALEIVQQRNAVKLHQGRAARDDNQRATEQANTEGRAALNALEARLKANDPDYARKREFLIPIARRITAKFPASEWAAETEKAYQELPALPAVPAATPPATPRPLPGPVRGGARVPVAQVPKDPFEALEMGIAAADGG